jgi:hypothetical protein
MPIPEPRPIREFDGMDRRRFDEEIRPEGQPAVFRGLAAEWPAVRAAKEADESFIAYLKALRTERPVAMLVGPPEIEGRFFYTDDIMGFNFQRGTSPLDPFFDRLLRDRQNSEPYSIAIQSEPVQELFPGFERENGLELINPDVIPRAWIGNAIRVAPHYDTMENVGCVVAGRRRFTLFPPEQLPNLYAGPFELTPAGTPISLVELRNPDLERFPRFAQAAETAQSTVLEPGDAIYIPFHWWHGVDSLEPINMFVNYWWNDRRPDIGSAYHALMHAFYALRHLPAEQRKVWRMTFDHYVFGTDVDPAEHLPERARGMLGKPTTELLGRMRATLKQLLGKL